jgi:hypothetical protein
MNIRRTGSELLRPTAFGPTRPSLVEVGASCFCVGTCRNRFHSVHKSEALVRSIRTVGSEDGSRLRRRFPFTGGSECPTPTGWTLSHHVRCTLVVAFEHRTHCSECLTTSFDCRGSKAMACSESNQRRRCLPSLLARSVRKGTYPPAFQLINVESSTVQQHLRREGSNYVGFRHRFAG